MSDIQKTIDLLKRTNPIKTNKIKIKLSLIIIFFLLMQVSLKLRPRSRLLRKINASKKVIEEVAHLLRSMLLRLQRKIKIKIILRIQAILSAILMSKKITTSTSVLNSQKTSSSLDNLHVNN